MHVALISQASWPAGVGTIEVFSSQKSVFGIEITDI
jgi:hypothetical protein